MKYHTVEIQLNDGDDVNIIRMTTAPFDIWLKLDGLDYEYRSAADLLKIGEVESSSDLSTKGIEVSLSGIDVAYQGVIENQGFLKAPLDVMLVELKGNSNEISSYSYFHRGYCDTPVTTLDYSGGTITIGVQTESVFRDLDKTPSLMRCSFSTHQTRHSGDKFFQYVQDTPVEEIWRT